MEQVLQHKLLLGEETVSLLESPGRILSETVYADRDFPAYDRVTKDGIAIDFARYKEGQLLFEIEAIAQAGSPQLVLKDGHKAIEVMTGAVLPQGTDTVVMYEHLEIVKGQARLIGPVQGGRNVHQQGTDRARGAVLIKDGVPINAAEIGVLAAVGRSRVRVKKWPNVAVISTGNELVPVEERPKPHQIRRSNTLTLQADLQLMGIPSSSYHVADDKAGITAVLEKTLSECDVLLLSGGVSKGKYDYIPEVMETLGVRKLFHRVAQRPGKPFWFGKHFGKNTVVFSFPGNPVSTFANFHLYFTPWLNASLGLPLPITEKVVLGADVAASTDLTRFIQVRLLTTKSGVEAMPIVENGSGDLTSLIGLSGFICLAPLEGYTPKEHGYPL